MIRFASILGAGLMALSLATPTLAADVTLKLGHIAVPEHPYGKGADYFAKLVGEKSNGSIDVKVFPSSQLGGQKDLIEGMVFGAVDMALVGTAVLGQFQPQISIFDMPFLFDDREHAYKSLDTVGMDLGKSLEGRGLKLLGYMENGIRHLTNDVRPVKTPDDMADMKVRVMTNKVFVEMMKSLGASPTPMAFSELYSAMQQGTVDGQENPSAHIFTKRFYEVQKYASKTAHAYSPEPMLISMISWGKLNDEQKAIIQEAAKEAIDWQRQVSEEQDNEYWKEIKATGKMDVIEVDRSKFKEATAPVYEMFAETVGQDNIDKIKALSTK
ncbi:tripartite ATP-independent transporter solute receptor, DctP family [Cohaesibacter sp. ES.047]|uniref:TRAP transporter substrate-binding protein n=1 Tax=Cohaesibacter sp. ES.047 TaxID=1798205 RepID=UPI000BB6F5FA|nr:DctP family TRAP transporter solute-binding subunit [Cohaesibacter sp. ES.047]SNY91291.1 tripartite ATP-independent transporter solute receptor, DctP family [Cohaesibacter sp. ES.047]